METSVKAVEPSRARSRRKRPSRQSRTIQSAAGGGRKEKAKSAERATARARSAEGWDGRAAWN
jgi:hypothetical protein